MSLLSEENNSFLKKIMRFAIPILLQEFVVNLTMMVTSLIVGGLEIYAIVAVGIANQIQFLFFMFCLGVCSATGVLIGQFFGKKDYKNIHNAIGICGIITLGFAILFALVTNIFPRQIFMVLSDNNETVAKFGVEYLRIYFVCFFFIALSETIKFALRSTGEMKIPIMASFSALIVDAIFCFLFVKVLKLSVTGAALAMAMAKCSELAVGIFLIRKRKAVILTNFKSYFKASKQFLDNYFKFATPVILNEIVWSLGTFMYTYCYQFTGTNGQGAFSITQTLQSMFTVLGFAVGTGCAILLSITLGANEIEKAKKYAKKSLIFNVGIGVFISAMLLIFGPFILRFYDVSQEVKDLSFHMMIVIAFITPIKMFNYTALVGVLRSGGDTTFCLVIDLVSVWLVGLPISLLAAYVFSLEAPFVALAIGSEEVFKMILLAKRLLKNSWAKNLVAHID